jgi:hypothetical protein
LPQQRSNRSNPYNFLKNTPHFQEVWTVAAVAAVAAAGVGGIVFGHRFVTV